MQSIIRINNDFQNQDHMKVEDKGGSDSQTTYMIFFCGGRLGYGTQINSNSTQ